MGARRGGAGALGGGAPAPGARDARAKWRRSGGAAVRNVRGGRVVSAEPRPGIDPATVAHTDRPSSVATLLALHALHATPDLRLDCFILFNDERCVSQIKSAFVLVLVAFLSACFIILSIYFLEM